jgi:hypothetical protein
MSADAVMIRERITDDAELDACLDHRRRGAEYRVIIVDGMA